MVNCIPLLYTILWFFCTQSYLEAGADFIETNTFNGTAVSQSDYGTQHLVMVTITMTLYTYVHVRTLHSVYVCMSTTTINIHSLKQMALGHSHDKYYICVLRNLFCALHTCLRTILKPPACHLACFEAVWTDSKPSEREITVSTPSGWPASKLSIHSPVLRSICDHARV